MEKQLFQGMTPKERRRTLEDNASKVYTGRYMRHFDEGQRAQRLNRNSDIDIELNAIDDELKAIKEEFKQKRQPLVDEKLRLLDEIRSNGEYVSGTLYDIVDEEAREVGTYDEDGNQVSQRRMTREDAQRTISFPSTGTEG